MVALSLEKGKGWAPWIALRVLYCLFAPAVPGCGEGFFNLTASLGGQVAGFRGSIQVLFINNTPYRAALTYGTLDPTDQFTEPDFLQFPAEDSENVLKGDTSSGIVELQCGRVFSVGSPQLLAFIESNLPDVPVDEEALVEGVAFFDVSNEEPATGKASPVGPRAQERLVQVGNALPLEALLGVDFPCNALLILRLEPTDAGSEAFRIDFELIPSESTR